MIVSFMIQYTFDRKSFTNSDKLYFFAFGFETCSDFGFLHRRYPYEVGTTYWLALTLDPSLWEMNQKFMLELHHVLSP